MRKRVSAILLVIGLLFVLADAAGAGGVWGGGKGPQPSTIVWGGGGNRQPPPPPAGLIWGGGGNRAGWGVMLKAAWTGLRALHF